MTEFAGHYDMLINEQENNNLITMWINFNMSTTLLLRRQGPILSCLELLE